MNSSHKYTEIAEDSIREKKSKTSEKKSVTFSFPLSSVYESNKVLKSSKDVKNDFDQINEEDEHNYVEMIDKVSIWLLIN